MIFSRAVKVGENADFPEFTGIQVHMQALTISYVRGVGTWHRCIEGVPSGYIPLVEQMLTVAAEDYERVNRSKEYGTLYVTIDEREIPAGQTHRRGGAHYDGVYYMIRDKDPRWNTVQHGGVLQGGGMIIAASHVGSRGWRGTLLGVAGPGGDCDHMRDQLKELEAFDMEAGAIYHGNATFVHESIPVAETTRRQLIRISYSKL